MGPSIIAFSAGCCWGFKCLRRLVKKDHGTIWAWGAKKFNDRIKMGIKGEGKNWEQEG